MTLLCFTPEVSLALVGHGKLIIEVAWSSSHTWWWRCSKEARKLPFLLLPSILSEEKSGNNLILSPSSLQSTNLHMGFMASRSTFLELSGEGHSGEISLVLELSDLRIYLFINVHNENLQNCTPSYSFSAGSQPLYWPESRLTIFPVIAWDLLALNPCSLLLYNRAVVMVCARARMGDNSTLHEHHFWHEIGSDVIMLGPCPRIHAKLYGLLLNCLTLSLPQILLLRWKHQLVILPESNLLGLT